MKITFSEGSGLNDSVYGKCQAPIRMFLEQRGEQFEQQSVLKDLFLMGTSENYGDMLTTMTAMSGFEPVGENGAYPTDGMKEGYNKLIVYDTWKDSFSISAEMIEDAKSKGYEVTCNIMAISNTQESDLDQALDMVAKSSADGIYIVDSYGALYPEQIRRTADKYTEIAEANGKFVGMHAHNNQQLAFANTIEAAARGVSLLDATMMGMGRGAGNCAMELLLSFLKNPKYNVFPVLKFIEEHMLPLKESGAVWGYDIPYLLTGRLNQHPSAAIDYIKSGETHYADFYTDLLDK